VRAAASDEGEEAMLLADDRRAMFAAVVAEDSRARVGQTVELAVDPSRFHFFDPESGLALARQPLAGAAH
jgi:multiple sugar transport system ATP-binding protein